MLVKLSAGSAAVTRAEYLYSSLVGESMTVGAGVRPTQLVTSVFRLSDATIWRFDVE